MLKGRDDPIQPISGPGDIEDADPKTLKTLLEVINLSSVAVFVFEPDSGSVLFANRHARERLGFSREQMRSTAIFDWENVFNSHEEWRRHVEELREKKEMVLDTTPKDVNGEPFSAEVHTRYVDELDDDYIIVVARDITERKQAEQNMQKNHVRLKELSYSDGLTGVPNRRAFDLKLARESQRHIREEKPLSLLIADIDHFKAYNDTFGHQRGDSCLKTVADCLNDSTLRSSDTVARYGGEEFVIVLPDTPDSGATHVADVLRQAVQDLNITHAPTASKSVVTVSIGVTTGRADQLNPKTLLHRADKALYRAKQNGRNRVASA